MLLCPLENNAIFSQHWMQVKPNITQEFGKNPSMYKKFGLAGHPGLDFRAPIGTPVFAPCEGQVLVVNDGTSGYGLHVKIRDKVFGREIILGHFSNVSVKSGEYLKIGQLVGDSGNSGYSTGPHLHMGLRFLVRDDSIPIFDWLVKEYGNSFDGFVDCLESLICFKGGINKTSIL